MANIQQPLTSDQQELIDLLRLAHQNLAIARKTKNAEALRRKAALTAEAERALQSALLKVEYDLDIEITRHEQALDDALVASYNAHIPVRRIAVDGFGNRYDGAVHQLLTKLRADGRVGSRDKWQGEDAPMDTVFPEPVDMKEMLKLPLTVQEPQFTSNGYYELVPESAPGAGDGMSVDAVLLTMDSRDSWFKSIAGNARAGTPWRNSTTATLYLHPHSGELTVVESAEEGETIWDHPVARWVKEHRQEALDGFLSVQRAASDSE